MQMSFFLSIPVSKTFGYKKATHFCNLTIAENTISKAIPSNICFEQTQKVEFGAAGNMPPHVLVVVMTH